jgi:signal transduction histidine kinase
MGASSLEWSLLPIWHVVERTVSEFIIAAQPKGIKLELKASTKSNAPGTSTDLMLAKVLGDSVKLTHVLRNLISNGSKFSEDMGKLTARVSETPLPPNKRKEETVVCGKEEVIVTKRGQIMIEVIDGVGMTPKEVRTAFDVATQLNANRFQAGGGSGLSMNIAQGWLQLMEES